MPRDERGARVDSIPAPDVEPVKAPLLGRRVVTQSIAAGALGLIVEACVGTIAGSKPDGGSGADAGTWDGSGADAGGADAAADAAGADAAGVDAGGTDAGAGADASGADAAGNDAGPPAPPMWQTVPPIVFIQGVAASISVAGFVSDPAGLALTLTRNAVALPAGVTFDSVGQQFVYDGIGAVGSSSGNVLTASDGLP